MQPSRLRRGVMIDELNLVLYYEKYGTRPFPFTTKLWSEMWYFHHFRAACLQCNDLGKCNELKSLQEGKCNSWIGMVLFQNYLDGVFNPKSLLDSTRTSSCPVVMTLETWNQVKLGPPVTEYSLEALRSDISFDLEDDSNLFVLDILLQDDRSKVTQLLKQREESVPTTEVRKDRVEESRENSCNSLPLELKKKLLLAADLEAELSEKRLKRKKKREINRCRKTLRSTLYKMSKLQSYNTNFKPFFWELLPVEIPKHTLAKLQQRVDCDTLQALLTTSVAHTVVEGDDYIFSLPLVSMEDEMFITTVKLTGNEPETDFTPIHKNSIPAEFSSMDIRKSSITIPGISSKLEFLHLDC
jgi:hypothetical protein